jgi:hypothetical protein
MPLVAAILVASCEAFAFSSRAANPRGLGGGTLGAFEARGKDVDEEEVTICCGLEVGLTTCEG